VPCPSAPFPQTTGLLGAYPNPISTATRGSRPTTPLSQTTGPLGGHATPFSSGTDGSRPTVPLSQATGLRGAHPAPFPTAPGGLRHSEPAQGVQSNNDRNEPAAHVNPQGNVNEAGYVGDGINDTDLDDSHDEGPHQIFSHNRTLLLLQLTENTDIDLDSAAHSITIASGEGYTLILHTH